MRTILLLSLLVNFLFLQATAQDSITSSDPSSPTSSVSLTPAMSSSSVAAQFSALATSAPQQPGDGEFHSKEE
jgi:hypothetical protein